MDRTEKAYWSDYVSPSLSDLSREIEKIYRSLPDNPKELKELVEVLEKQLEIFKSLSADLDGFEKKRKQRIRDEVRG